MNLLKIVEQGLIVNGYGGLYNDGECACHFLNLSPHKCLNEKCTPGYVHIHGKTDELIICDRKEPMTDDQIRLCIENAG